MCVHVRTCFSHGKTGRDIFVTIPNCSVYKFRNVHNTQPTKHEPNVVDIKCVSNFLIIFVQNSFCYSTNQVSYAGDAQEQCQLFGHNLP